jgi:hypothetical protein
MFFQSELFPDAMVQMIIRQDPSQANKVVVCSGHMIDQPDRSSPRFPSYKEKIVQQQIADQLRTWDIGSGDLAICSGAQGTDLLFAECCVALGTEVDLMIPLPEEEFLRRSIHLEGADWESRYFELTKNCSVSRFFLEDFLKNSSPELDAVDNVFAQNNLWIISTALAIISPENLFAILVWDERNTGDGPGGTSDFAARILQSHGKVVVINPTKL